MIGDIPTDVNCFIKHYMNSGVLMYISCISFYLQFVLFCLYNPPPPQKKISLHIDN